MRRDLTGKVALVTGSAHRVGKAIALELARRGVHQVVHYNNSDAEAIQTTDEIIALGVQAIRVKADQSDPTQVDTLFEAIRAKFGRLDILVNSASIFQEADLLTLSYADWQKTLAVNVTGPFLCTQHAARLMRATGQGGVIINISDNGGLKGWPSYPGHSVSKAGLLMLTKVAARSLAPDIRVNAIVPGMVLQPPGNDEAQWKRHAQRTPIKRPGTAEDVAHAVAYLAEEDYVTGAVLTVDGGEALM
ncbi:MAG: SDR family NAD(P)-dependent oxidoreductase [Aggregatilineales bacterium]